MAGSITPESVPHTSADISWNKVCIYTGKSAFLGVPQHEFEGKDQKELVSQINKIYRETESQNPGTNYKFEMFGSNGENKMFQVIFYSPEEEPKISASTRNNFVCSEKTESLKTPNQIWLEKSPESQIQLINKIFRDLIPKNTEIKNYLMQLKPKNTEQPFFVCRVSTWIETPHNSLKDSIDSSEESVDLSASVVGSESE